MDRKLYLELCQKVSMLKELAGIKQNLLNDMLVEYDSITYYPVAYKLWFKNGETQHTAILHSLTTNTIIECELRKVIPSEQTRNNSVN